MALRVDGTRVQITGAAGQLVSEVNLPEPGELLAWSSDSTSFMVTSQATQPVRLYRIFPDGSPAVLLGQANGQRVYSCNAEQTKVAFRKMSSL